MPSTGVASFLDIGCGSGLPSLAAGRLGAARIYAIDIDPQSVVTTHSVLNSAHDFRTQWNAETMDAFNLDPGRHGRFDIVYSWGVLHQTGKMWAALRRSAAMVKPGGLLAIAARPGLTAFGASKNAAMPSHRHARRL